MVSENRETMFQMMRSLLGCAKGEIKRMREGEAECRHGSNLLMVEGKQTISHYLCESKL